MMDGATGHVAKAAGPKYYCFFIFTFADMHGHFTFYHKEYFFDSVYVRWRATAFGHKLFNNAVFAVSLR